MNDEEKREVVLSEIAKAAAKLNDGVDPIEIMIEGIRRIPDQMQMMVDSIVAMQDEFPMPKEGWEAFMRDIEYTNQKHGLNLVLRKV